MRIKPLPPMNSLIVFEAAARLLSFTRAADQLNVTQGAISRQIKQLEDYLGRKLFIRANRNISLTPIGMQYYQTIYESLLDISSATSEIKKWKGESQITVATTSAIASLWLLPKFSSFQQNENIDLRILTIENIADLKKTGYDIALFFCKKSPQNMHVTTLFPEEVFPVCSPSYLAKLNNFEDPLDIFRQNMLYLDESQKDWITWSEWFERLDLPKIIPKNRMNINSYPLLIQAAIHGQGVALAWGSLLDDYLEKGLLVRPIDKILKTETDFCILEPSDRGGIPLKIKDFRNWLITISKDEIGEIGLTDASILTT